MIHLVRPLLGVMSNACNRPKADLSGLRQVRSELEVITKDLKIDLVQWAELKADCEGHPASMPNAAVLMGREQRVAADAVVQEIKRGWRD